MKLNRAARSRLTFAIWLGEFLEYIGNVDREAGHDSPPDDSFHVLMAEAAKHLDETSKQFANITADYLFARYMKGYDGGGEHR